MTQHFKAKSSKKPQDEKLPISYKAAIAKGLTIFHAIRGNSLDLVKEFLRHEVRVDEEELARAVGSKNLTLVRTLLREVTAIYQPDLEKAVLAGHVSKVQKLLRQAIGVNAINVQRRTPLMVAARYNRYDIVEFLLKQENIKVNSEDNCGRTAIIHAAEMGFLEMAKLLRGRHNSKHQPARITAKKVGGLTPLLAAKAAKKPNLELINYLEEQEHSEKTSMEVSLLAPPRPSISRPSFPPGPSAIISQPSSSSKQPDAAATKPTSPQQAPKPKVAKKKKHSPLPLSPEKQRALTEFTVLQEAVARMKHQMIEIQNWQKRYDLSARIIYQNLLLERRSFKLEECRSLLQVVDQAAHLFTAIQTELFKCRNSKNVFAAGGLVQHLASEQQTELIALFASWDTIRTDYLQQSRERASKRQDLAQAIQRREALEIIAERPSPSSTLPPSEAVHRNLSQFDPSERSGGVSLLDSKVESPVKSSQDLDLLGEIVEKIEKLYEEIIFEKVEVHSKNQHYLKIHELLAKGIEKYQQLSAIARNFLSPAEWATLNLLKTTLIFYREEIVGKVSGIEVTLPPIKDLPKRESGFAVALADHKGHPAARGFASSTARCCQELSSPQSNLEKQVQTLMSKVKDFEKKTMLTTWEVSEDLVLATGEPENNLEVMQLDIADWENYIKLSEEIESLNRQITVLTFKTQDLTTDEILQSCQQSLTDMEDILARVSSISHEATNCGIRVEQAETEIWHRRQFIQSYSQPLSPASSSLSAEKPGGQAGSYRAVKPQPGSLAYMDMTPRLFSTRADCTPLPGPSSAFFDKSGKERLAPKNPDLSNNSKNVAVVFSTPPPQ